MDPSEFEGTVAREGSALSAGALEHLLEKSQPDEIDFTQDCNDLRLLIFNLKEALSKFDANPWSSLAESMEEKAVYIAERREDYLTRRKNLTGSVKLFITDQLEKLTEETIELFKPECKNIIDYFKKEFDNLSGLSKHSEAAFMSIFKYLNDISDPTALLTESLRVSVRANEALQLAQEQLEYAEEALAEQNEISETPAITQKWQKEIERLQESHHKEVEEVKQSSASELDSLRSRFESELKLQEEKLRNDFEVKQLDSQSHFEKLLERKDVEAESLLRTINEFKQSNMESLERGKSLEAESSRRREVEEKFRVALVEMSDLKSTNQELHSYLDRGKSRILELEMELKKMKATLKSEAESLKTEIEEQRSKLQRVEQELDCRPPIDFSELMVKVGMTGDPERAHILSSSSFSWTDMEQYLVEAIRKSNSDATYSRVREQELAKLAASLEEECEKLRTSLKEKTDLAVSLEADLLQAHQTLQNSAKTHGKSKIKAKQKDPESGIADGLDNLMSGIDVEGEAEGMEEGNSSSGSANDRLMRAVRDQRDRYMRSTREKEQELVSLKEKHDRAFEELEQLRNENLELYRRLRVLRVSGTRSTGGQGSLNRSASAAGESLQQSAVRSRRGIGGDPLSEEQGDFDGDKLDEKYLELYEADISPFRVAELDKQTVLSRLNVFERMLAYVSRHVLTDRWARHALLVYLGLVHCLALGYVVQVLNPQLIEEVDAHLKAKWSAESMAQHEHPDI